ncbi:MAG TPA: hypothetical protein DDW24_10010 [Blastocatellia bacterium]|nr:hypothetical protein [Chloracidobacterium sp.]HBE83099.1 hypothetical protein [Blastocatellia bacterium]HRJ89012.1 hypothetical protein [Pyrinomonadaceae bacterium]
MKLLRTMILVFASISYVVVIGGAVYEHTAIVPVWTSAVPASLAMYQGEYAIVPARFWIPIHPVTISLLLLALLLNWRTDRRSPVMATIVAYIIVLAVTFTYFVPELMSLTRSEYLSTMDPGLTARAARWEFLSLIRLGWMILFAVVLLVGLSKSDEVTD